MLQSKPHDLRGFTKQRATTGRKTAGAGIYRVNAIIREIINREYNRSL